MLHMKLHRRRRRLGLVVAIAVLGGLVSALWTLRRELRAWYLLRTGFELLSRNEQGFVEYRHLRTGILFVRLPGGKFLMGTSAEERRKVVEELGPGSSWTFVEEEPEHTVTLSAFLIAKYEVTQAEWVRVMGENPAFVKGENHPVENVTWHACREFGTRTGLALPTEAQWEYACRAGTNGRYGGTGVLEEMGWSAESGEHQHFAVGGKKPNGFGLHDMHGNVAEWVEDLEDKGFYSRPDASCHDPVCMVSPDNEFARVFRGGGCHNPLFCRSAVRCAFYSDQGTGYLGFRPVFNLR